MGDCGDYWRESKVYRVAESQKKRKMNRKSSAQMLTKQGVSFETRNYGEHLIVTDGGDTYDFWPGTGKWNRRGDAFYFRGVKELIGTIVNRRSKDNA